MYIESKRKKMQAYQSLLFYRQSMQNAKQTRFFLKKSRIGKQNV